jgi:hypothetical protein
MSTATIQREVTSTDADVCAVGLRRLARWCGADSVTNERPADWPQRRAQVAELTPRLLELAESTDEVLRELAADALGAVLCDGALAALLKLCDDTVERVRATALGALEGFPDDDQARRKLLDALYAKPWTVRMRAARALIAFRGADIDDALFAALLDDDSHVRSLAGESLKVRPHDAWSPRLRKLIEHHPAPQQLDAAMDLMGAAGTAADAAFLKKVGSHFNLSQPSFVRAWARTAARAIGQRSAVPGSSGVA